MYLKLYTLLHVAEVEFHQLVYKLDQFLQGNRIQLFTTNNTIASSCSLKQHNRILLLTKNNTIASSCSLHATEHFHIQRHNHCLLNSLRKFNMPKLLIVEAATF